MKNNIKRITYDIEDKNLFDIWTLWVSVHHFRFQFHYKSWRPDKINMQTFTSYSRMQKFIWHAVSRAFCLHLLIPYLKEKTTANNNPKLNKDWLHVWENKKLLCTVFDFFATVHDVVHDVIYEQSPCCEMVCSFLDGFYAQKDVSRSSAAHSRHNTGKHKWEMNLFERASGASSCRTRCAVH